MALLSVYSTISNTAALFSDSGVISWSSAPAYATIALHNEQKYYWVSLTLNGILRHYTVTVALHDKQKCYTVSHEIQNFPLVQRVHPK